jgi:hypothetical protein
MSNLIEQLESELAAAQHGGNQDDIRDAAMNLSEAHCGEEITRLRAENAALAAKLSAAEAKLRAVRERVEPFMQTPVTIQLVGNRVETSPLGEALLAIHELSNQLTKEQA